MEITAILMVCSALLIIPTLTAGAWMDIKERRFPKEYWECWDTKIAGILTIFAYMMMFANGKWFDVVFYIAVSVLLTLAFYGAGIRFGAGGDWRALIYIVVICPWLILGVIGWSLFSGFIIAIAYVCRKPDTLDKTPFFARTIPFAVAILIGHMAALSIFILHNL